jgi:hypothetical protein
MVVSDPTKTNPMFVHFQNWQRRRRQLFQPTSIQHGFQLCEDAYSKGTRNSNRSFVTQNSFSHLKLDILMYLTNPQEIPYSVAIVL